MQRATTVRAVKTAGKDISNSPRTEASSSTLSKAQGQDQPKSSSIPDALRHFDQLPDSAHVRQPVVEALFGYSSSTVWRRVRDGLLPKPERLGPRTTAWNVGKLRRALRGEAA
jgi:predicted DNA-binding transcriptional regulator AlpA